MKFATWQSGGRFGVSFNQTQVQRREDDNDPLLRPLLRAATAEEREAVLEALLAEHAYARIDRALDSRYRQSALSPSHREDIRAEVLLRLVNRLHALVHDDGSEPVMSFCDYVAVVAFNTFDGFLRRSYPLRSKLKNRIRYALRHDPRLAEWHRGGEPVAGLTEWRESVRVRESDRVMDQIETPRAIRQTTGDLRPLLVQILGHAGRPVTVSALVSAIADLQNLPGLDAAQLDDAHPSQQRNVVDDLANASFLREVWAEICELPLKQRIALLLNARDAAGESVVRVLPVTGIASARQIGETLAIDSRELAALWNELPLEDTRIAVLLHVTRQQVINLRQAARNRLARRLHKQPAKGRRGA